MIDLDNLKVAVCPSESQEAARIFLLHKGCSFFYFKGYNSFPYLWKEDGRKYRIGDYFQDNDRFMITKVFYEPKKWWQFWKCRQIVGYEVACIRD